MNRKLVIPAEEMRKIAAGFGACIATDMITVEGHGVGYMYCKKTDNPLNDRSFMAENEAQEYIENAEFLESDSFACRVIAAEGMTPEYEKKWGRTIGTKYFQRGI